MNYVRIDHTSYTQVTRERDPDDDWSGEDTNTSNYVNGLILVPEGSYHHIAVPFDIDINKSYILLWAEYSTGDSFSHDEGKVEFIDLFENVKHANAAYRAIQKANDADQSNVKYYRADGSEVNFYAPWYGYFERLSDLYIDVVRVVRIEQ